MIEVADKRNLYREFNSLSNTFTEENEKKNKDEDRIEVFYIDDMEYW